MQYCNMMRKHFICCFAPLVLYPTPLLVHLEKEYDEVKDDVHFEIFKDGKRFRITPLK